MTNKNMTRFLVFCFGMSMLLVFMRLIAEDEIGHLATLLVAIVGTFTMFRDMWNEAEND